MAPSPCAQETIALRSEALTARSDELDCAVKEALQPLLTTVPTSLLHTCPSSSSSIIISIIDHHHHHHHRSSSSSIIIQLSSPSRLSISHLSDMQTLVCPQMEGVRADVASQGAQLQELPTALSNDVQGVHRRLQGLIKAQSQLAARVDNTADKADVQAAVAAALQPYRTLVHELQAAVGSQGGQLSSLLPALSEGLQGLQDAVKVRRNVCFAYLYCGWV